MKIKHNFNTTPNQKRTLGSFPKSTPSDNSPLKTITEGRVQYFQNSSTKYTYFIQMSNSYVLMKNTFQMVIIKEQQKSITDNISNINQFIFHYNSLLGNYHWMKLKFYFFNNQQKHVLYFDFYKIEPIEHQNIKMSTNQDKIMKAMAQKEKREKVAIQEYKQKMLPFVSYLKNKQLRFTHARVGTSRIEYFRIDEFEKILANNSGQIQSNQQLKVIQRQVREELIYFKRPSHLKAKYPDMLEPVTADCMEKKYACFRFDTTQSKKGLMFGIIFAVLSLVLFPIWPFQLKYGLWLISFSLLVFLIGLILLRLVIYLVCVMFGFDVWILPNLFEDKGFVGSFKPIFYYQKWEKSWFNTFLRVFVVSSIVALCCYLYLNPHTILETISATKQTARDIHDWGVLKIKNEKNFSQRAITNLDHILNQTAEITNEQSTQQQYTSFNETMQSQL